MSREMALSALLVAVVVLVFHLSSQQLTVDHECYVKPEDANVSCPSPCYTLQEYAHNKDVVRNCSLGTANTAYIFLNGVHELSGNISLNFFRTDSIYLVGKALNSTHYVPHAEIVCNKQEAGFVFQHATNIAVTNLTITGCGCWYDYIVPATLGFYNVTNVTIDNVIVRNSTGYGVYALCAMGKVEVVDSVFAFNKGTADYDGGNVAFHYENCTETSTLLTIRFSHFLHGYGEHINPIASGLYVFVWTTGVNVEIDNITAVGNVAANNSTGGNVALFLRNRTSILSNWVIVNNSYIAEGSAYTGAGMYVSITDTPLYDAASHDNTVTATHRGVFSPVLTPEIITIINTHFISNHAVYEGGGLYVVTHEQAAIFAPIGNVTVKDCVFCNNSLSNEVGGGVAVHLINHYVLSYLNHSVPQFYTSLVNCTIKSNVLLVKEGLVDTIFTGSGAVFIIQNNAGVLLEDCRIVHNACTGITTVLSNVVFAGNVTVSHNVGTDGGGIILCDNSYMMLKANTTLVLQENRARHAGGGIYAEDSCLQSKPPCFFQLDIELYENQTLQDTVHVQLINNMASYAGSAIYGGSVNFCYLFPQYIPALKRHGTDMFKHIFKITHPPSDLSVISSNPYQVCYCNCNRNNCLPDCSVQTIKSCVYPGEQLSFYALTVGQCNGSAYRTVLASLMNPKNDSRLGQLEASQRSQQNCSKFQYTVFSRLSSEVIELRVQHLGIRTGARGKGVALVNVTLRQCPIGFAITLHSPHKCGCVPTLAAYRVKNCTIQDQTIHRNPPTWIGIYVQPNSSKYYQISNSNSTDYGVMVSRHCPYDFCKADLVKIKTGPVLSNFQGNMQCAYHRVGILCGECENNYSLILGNSECRKCSDKNLWLLLVFVIAGLLLVLLLIVTELNVSSGSMSGLIFYANLVQVNRAVFFPPVTFPSTLVYLCSVFIAWLNLDFGIDMCFYNGMDAYAKTWLQFAFPIYVWGIAAIIILLSRRFPSIAGRNPVRVLATLFLLSYAKLLRTIITALSPTQLHLSTADGNTTMKLVWREDGNIDYLRGKHVPLFVVALGFGLVTFPYAVVLFIVQWLQKNSHRCGCSWVVKMKPLLDAYTGPYKTHCRFWTGSLLLLRVVTFVAFATPVADPNMKLSLILATCVTVQMIAWSFRGVFQSISNDILNSVFLLNLGLFSVGTSYTSRTGHGNQAVVICISVGVSWIVFNLILIYSTFLQIRATKKWNCLQPWFIHTCCYSLFRKTSARVTFTSTGNADAGYKRLRSKTTYSIVDPFDIQYREPLISSGSGSYGT